MWNWKRDPAPNRQSRIDTLAALFENAGLPDPVRSAKVEIDEQTPVLASQLFLRKIWVEHIDGWTDSPGWMTSMIADARSRPNGSFADAGQALERLLATGAERQDLASLARSIAYEVAFGIVHLIDEGSDIDRDDDGGYPGWALYECHASGASTGRQMTALHETILVMDPSGLEGRPGGAG